MLNGLIETTVSGSKPADRRIYGVAVGLVINNIDLSGQSRVQVKLSWLPGVEPWARVAVPMAGDSRGTYFIPQINDEVLLAFNNGDVREPFVVGSLWNGRDRPPALSPTDAVAKRIVRTPLGHEVEFDDATQSITITSSTKQKVSIDPKRIELKTAGGTATLSLDTEGTISFQAAVSVKISAPSVTLSGGRVSIESDGDMELKAGGPCAVQSSLTCDISAPLVNIN